MLTAIIREDPHASLMAVAVWSSDLQTLEQVRMAEAPTANQALMTAYLVKAEVQTLWTPCADWGWWSTWK
ncbi:hypothetical protein [Pseudomonas sp. NPDC089741]|uniref:hypothetical protein n=1 Tax=Pseudomonas sp. NPDC089741 TaxID=3364470 RepID=UPI003806FA2F